MKTNNWLSIGNLTKVFMTLVFAVLWTACADDSAKPVITDDAAARISDSNPLATTETYTSTVTLSQTNGGGTQVWSYEINSVVTWVGSTTTWTYSIKPTLVSGDNSSVKNLSHTVLAGFDNCFWSNLSTSGIAESDEGSGTGCNVSKGIKYDALTTPYWSATYTFNGALKVNEEAATLYVKAGNDCQPVSIPGPSCEALGLSGSLNQIACQEGNTYATVPFGGATVTATQGTDVRTATTAADGSYSFSNLGGVWTLSATGVYANASTSVEVGPADGVAAAMTVDNRVNGSCAAISGHADRTDCVNQSPITTAYAGASVMSGTTVVATTDANGNFTISNAVNGTYNLTIDGVSLTSVTVADSQGSYAAGSVTISFITSLCGGTVNPACSLSQGYWFAKPQAVWGNGGTVTLGGKVYTQAEGKAIWNTSNKGGLLNAKAAFTQASAIKLSNVAASASVWADVAIIDAYFASIPKISATSIPKNSTANAAAGAAAGRIGQWIDANHCSESN